MICSLGDNGSGTAGGSGIESTKTKSESKSKSGKSKKSRSKTEGDIALINNVMYTFLMWPILLLYRKWWRAGKWRRNFKIKEWPIKSKNSQVQKVIISTVTADEQLVTHDLYIYNYMYTY